RRESSRRTRPILRGLLPARPWPPVRRHATPRAARVPWTCGAGDHPRRSESAYANDGASRPTPLPSSRGCLHNHVDAWSIGESFEPAQVIAIGGVERVPDSQIETQGPRSPRTARADVEVQQRVAVRSKVVRIATRLGLIDLDVASD